MKTASIRGIFMSTSAYECGNNQRSLCRPLVNRTLGNQRSRKATCPPVALAISMLLLLVLSLPSMSMASLEGPVIEIPAEGGPAWTNDPLMNLTGTAMPRNHTLTMDQSILGDVDGTGMRWVDGELRFNQTMLFSDEFGGTALDGSLWDTVYEFGSISVTQGNLVLDNNGGSYPLITSKDPHFPKNQSWNAQIRMRYQDWGLVGSGGGISTGFPSPDKGPIGSFATHDGFSYKFEVYSNGVKVIDRYKPDSQWNIYVVEFECTGKAITTRMNDDLLSTWTTRASFGDYRFWFGTLQEYSSKTNFYEIYVDHVRLWTTSGSWVSEPYDLGHEVSIDSLVPNWTSSHPSKSHLGVSIRASSDGMNWSGWTEVVDGRPSTPLEGRWLQLSIEARLDDVEGDGPGISIHDIGLGYHIPTRSVWVAVNDGEWRQANGADDWHIDLQVDEGLNSVRVRAVDEAGFASCSTREYILDTIPPTGRVWIQDNATLTNSTSVRLMLDGGDRWGIERIDVSNFHDFKTHRSYDNISSIEWTIEGVEGVNQVFVRFVDPSGLASEPAVASISFDSLPPECEFEMNGGDKYAPEATVTLGVSANDASGITELRVSNFPDLSESTTYSYTEGEEILWELLDGEAGERMVFIKVTDNAGNSLVVQDTIGLHPPTVIGEIVIEDGVTLTNLSVVDLAIGVPLSYHAKMMQLSSDPAFKDAEWVPVEEDVLWVVGPDDGNVTVYVRFINFRDIPSLAAYDSITVDRTPPTIDLVTTDGSYYVSSMNVSISINYTDTSPVSLMWYNLNGQITTMNSVPFCNSIICRIEPREGPKGITLYVMDEAGNIGVGTIEVYFTSRRPVVVAQFLGGTLINRPEGIEITIEWVDEFGVVDGIILVDGKEHGRWEPLHRKYFLDLPPGLQDGSYNISFIARNIAGLESDPFVAEIRLDTTPPKMNIVSPEDGSTLVRGSRTVSVLVESYDNSTVNDYRYRVDNGTWVDVDVHDDGYFNIVMSSYDRHSLTIEATDEAGHTTAVSVTFYLEEAPHSQISMVGLLVVVLFIVASIVVVYNERYKHVR